MANPSSTLKTNTRIPVASTVREWWSSRSKTEKIIMGLAVLRVVIALIFMLNVLPLDRRFRWYLQHGGDQNEFLKLAISIIEGGEPHITLVAIGPALMYVPWILLLYHGSYSYLTQLYFEIVAPLVVINGFILGALSVLVIGSLARKVTRDDRVAVIAAGLWSILPLLAYFAFFWHFDAPLVRSATVPKVGWLNGLSDGPATFYVMVAAMALAFGINDGKGQPFWRMVGAGLAMGAAIIFRVHIAPAIAVLMLYALVAYGWRNLGIIVVSAFVAYLPQAWYNVRAFNFPFTTGYISAHYVWGREKQLISPDFEIAPIWTRFPFSPMQFVETWNHHIVRRPWLVIPLFIAIFTIISLSVILWRRMSWRPVVLLIVVPLSYLGPIAATWPFRDDPIRFAMPAYPYLIIMMVYIFFVSADYFISKKQKHAEVDNSASD